MMDAPDFKGFKKITDEEATLLAPLGVVWYDQRSILWNKRRPYAPVCGLLEDIKASACPHQFYAKVEDDSDNG